jgi:cobalt/nickel transport system ATP-binding protein
VSSVEVDQVSFAYPDGHLVLDRVGVMLAAGERVAVLGPNGAGKTTLLLQLNGLLLPSTGVVRIGGVAVERPTFAAIRRAVGMVFQDPGDQLFLRTVHDDVAFGPSNQGMRDDELERRVAAALGQVGLPGHGGRRSHHLSFGEQRRVAVATVLATDPTVLALDEPTSNLDPRSRRQLIEVLDGLDLTLVAATHDLAFALEVCPRSVVLVDGRVMADGPTAELLADDAVLGRASLELPYGLDPRLLAR